MRRAIHGLGFDQIASQTGSSGCAAPLVRCCASCHSGLNARIFHHRSTKNIMLPPIKCPVAAPTIQPRIGCAVQSPLVTLPPRPSHAPIQNTAQNLVVLRLSVHGSWFLDLEGSPPVVARSNFWKSSCCCSALLSISLS